MLEESERQRRRDREAREAMARAASNLLEVRVPAPESEGMTISQEEVEAAEREEAPAEMTITQEEVEAAERESAPMQRAPGARPDSPFRVLPPGQTPPRTEPYFPPRSNFATADLPDIGPEPADVQNPSPRAPAPPPTSEPAQAIVPPREPAQAQDLSRPESEVEFLDPTEEDSPRKRLEPMLRQRVAQAQQQRPDYTGVDTADAFRRVLHAIGSGLRAAGGGSPIPFRSLGEEARRGDAQRAQVDQRTALAGQRAKQEAGESDLAQRRMALQERQLDANTANQEANRSLQERMQTRAAELRAQGRTEQEALALARREALQSELTRSQALRTADSNESRMERETLLAEIDTARQELGFEPPPSAMEFLRNATGEQVQRYRETLTEQGILRPRTHRRGGRGGGQGGARTATPESVEDLQAALAEAGIPPESVDLSTQRGRDQARAELRMRSRDGGAMGEGMEIMPGVFATMDIGAVEARNMRAGVSEARSHAASLGAIDQIAEREGLQATVDPRIAADLEPHFQSMLAMVAALRNSGVINGSEYEQIAASVPNATNIRQQSLGEVQRRVRSFRNQMETRVRGNLAVLGVDEAGQDRVIGFLGSGRFGGGQQPAQRPGQQAPVSGSNIIRVMVNGRERRFTPETIDRARALARQRGDSFEPINAAP